MNFMSLFPKLASVIAIGYTIVWVTFVVINAANMPLMDDYGAILEFLNKFTDADAWGRAQLLMETHNEHRIATTRGAAVAGYLLSGTANFTWLILVGTALAAQGHWPGVALLGRVADLAPLYARADIVISPLRAGSGLKIKLVEALAAGKAIIASPATLQGVEATTRDAVMVAETAAEFLAAIDLLLRDGDQRAVLAGRALREAGTRFSAEAAYGPLIHALRQAIAAPAVTTTHAA